MYGPVGQFLRFKHKSEKYQLTVKYKDGAYKKYIDYGPAFKEDEGKVMMGFMNQGQRWVGGRMEKDEMEKHQTIYRFYDESGNEVEKERLVCVGMVWRKWAKGQPKKLVPSIRPSAREGYFSTPTKPATNVGPVVTNTPVNISRPAVKAGTSTAAVKVNMEHTSSEDGKRQVTIPVGDNTLTIKGVSASTAKITRVEEVKDGVRTIRLNIQR